MLFQNESCGGCKRDKKAVKKKDYNLFTGILLAILPKCPFCVMAYTSTAVLCGKDTLIESSHHHYSVVTICITSFLCVLVIAGILLNYRDVRTKYALAISVLGSLLILKSIIFSGGQQLYYIGVLMIFISVWLNGSLLSILRKLKRTFDGNTNVVESGTYS